MNTLLYNSIRGGVFVLCFSLRGGVFVLCFSLRGGEEKKVIILSYIYHNGHT